MAERAIHRKSQLIFNSVIPVTDTHEELVKKKLKAGKFPFTITSLIKVFAIVSESKTKNFWFCVNKSSVFFLVGTFGGNRAISCQTAMCEYPGMVRLFIPNFTRHSVILYVALVHHIFFRLYSEKSGSMD